MLHKEPTKWQEDQKKTRGTNAAGMAKPKPETFHAYINLKVHSYTNGMVLLGHDNIIHIYAR